MDAISEALADAERANDYPRLRALAEAAIAKYKGRMQILYVLPDYYQRYPKPCYGGWGKLYIVVTPDGRVVVVEHVLGAVLAQLGFSPSQYWKDRQ